MIVFSHGGDDAQHLERDPVQDDVGQGEQVEQPQECDGEAQKDPQPVIEAKQKNKSAFIPTKPIVSYPGLCKIENPSSQILLNFVNVHLLEILP